MAHKKHPKQEKSSNYGLLIFSVLAVVVCIALLIGLYVYLTNDSEPTSSSQSSVKNVCDSPECFHLAHQMHNFGNKSVDPCVDFYEYTCGRYSEHVPIGSIPLMKEKTFENTIEEYLYRNRKVMTASTSETIMKKLYNFCSSFSIVKASPHTVDSFIEDVLADIKRVGPWPMMEPSFDESKFGLSQYLENMAGSFNLENLGLFKIDASNLLGIVSDVEAYSMSPAKRRELESNLLLFIKRVNKAFDQNTFEKDLADVFDLHRSFEKLDAPSGTNFKQVFDIPDLVSVNHPHMNFEKILKNFLGLKHPEHWEDLKEYIFVMPASSYYTKDGKLLQLIRSTPPRTMANFLFIRTFQVLFDLVDYRPFEKCSTAVVNLMPQAALRVYFQNYFDKANLKSGAELAEKIKEAFLIMFRNSNWLHQETKDNAIQKLEKMRTIVGYPDELEAPGSLDKRYEELIDLSPDDSFYVLNRKIRAFTSRSHLMDLRRKNQFSLGLEKANAFYHGFFNVFVLCIPLIDAPLFASSLPEVAKMTIVGFIIGHEIGHAFDTVNMNLDGDGNQTDWWNPDDRSEYAGRHQCLIDQYDNHDDPSFGKNLKGSTTLQENIPDIIGAKTAWIAYKKSAADQPSIIGFENYAPDKLFFHLRALFFCSVYDTHKIELQLSSTHGINNFRVNGVYANIKEFAEAFQCPIGSPMNPEKKCELF